MKDGYVTTQPQLARVAAKSPYRGITGCPRQCAVVLFSVGEEAKMQFNTSSAWYFGPLKIFSSTLRAKDFCEKKARELIGRDSSLVLHWENEATLRLLKKNGEAFNCSGLNSNHFCTHYNVA